MNKIIQTIAALTCAIFGLLFGEMDGLIKALIIFMVLDYCTGVAVAIKKKELSSEIGFVGIIKKVFILVFVAVGHVLDAYVIGEGAMCRGAVAGFFIANEGLSILENGAIFGLPIPRKLKEILLQLRGRGDGDEKTDV
ncbi:MAG: phage holin family protein [Ruminococcus sp.]|nr:phage holin family protein [Ruminococcus sp.]MDO4863406.1 phage holin family protein [Ruminococcus sp.]